MSNEVKSQAFVLRVVAAQEADVIVKLLTRTGEQISAFAKAGLKSRKRFGGSLEPLTNVEFRAVKKNNQDLYYLEETQTRHDFENIKKDIERLAAASYVAEVIEHSAQEGLEHPELYNLFGATMRALDAGLSWLGVLRQFEVKLLAVMGWLPSLMRCEGCGSVGNDLTLSPDQGTVTCADCGIAAVPVSRETQEIVKKLMQTSVTQSNITDREAQQVEKVTSSLLQAHWGQQKLKSVQFLGSLRRFQK
jgi:DNA repair protein RecO (recombination protein O)